MNNVPVLLSILNKISNYVSFALQAKCYKIFIINGKMFYKLPEECVRV